MKNPAFMRWIGWGKFGILARMKTQTPLARQIGKNIAKLRDEHDWSQEQLAEKVEVDDSTVQRWECGCTVPCGFDVLKLSVAFEVGTDAIYEGLPRSIDALRNLYPSRCAEHASRS